MRRIALLSALVLCTVPAGAVVWATPTDITVRVLSHDAKLIGDLSGGAHVTLRDADTGRVLAEGMHWGGTGDTDLIIRQPHERGVDRFGTEGAAGFTATVELERPTWITAEARAPLGFPATRAAASQTFLALPGEDITGDGIVLELYGLIVNLLAPTAETPVTAGSALAVEAGVKLLCTCPITPGGLWDADQYTVVARLFRRDEMVAEARLGFSGTTNVFSGTLDVPDTPGILELRVTAANADRRNYGMDARVFRIHAP